MARFPRDQPDHLWREQGRPFRVLITPRGDPLRGDIRLYNLLQQPFAVPVGAAFGVRRGGQFAAVVKFMDVNICKPIIRQDGADVDKAVAVSGPEAVFGLEGDLIGQGHGALRLGQPPARRGDKLADQEGRHDEPQAGLQQGAGQAQARDARGADHGQFAVVGQQPERRYAADDGRHGQQFVADAGQDQQHIIKRASEVVIAASGVAQLIHEGKKGRDREQQKQGQQAVGQERAAQIAVENHGSRPAGINRASALGFLLRQSLGRPYNTASSSASKRCAHHRPIKAGKRPRSSRVWAMPSRLL